MSSNVNPKTVPAHVAIIMDGNRRWAREKGLKDIEGHQRAVEKIKELVEQAARNGVKHITFWAFSTENWSRNKEFLSEIFWLFRSVLDRKSGLFDNLQRNGGQLHILGDVSKFPEDIHRQITNYLKEPGPGNKVIDVNFALNYGGRDELVRAVRKMVEKGYRPAQITPELIGQFLDTAGQPDVDLLIRTGGEIRTSGFLLWQLNYAEFYFTPTYFPDFGKAEFEKALEDYSRRNRRFGGDSPTF